MSDDLSNYRRWHAADAGERDEDADAAFQVVFQSVVPEPPISPAFTTQTMTAIAAAAAGDARRARYVRAAVLSGTIAATAGGVYAGAGWAIALVSTAFLGLLNLLVGAVVRTAAIFQTGAGVWGVLSNLGQATAALSADTNVTFAMIALSAVAIAALVALQRLLGADEESFQ